MLPPSAEQNSTRKYRSRRKLETRKMSNFSSNRFALLSGPSPFLPPLRFFFAL